TGGILHGDRDGVEQAGGRERSRRVVDEHHVAGVSPDRPKRDQHRSLTGGTSGEDSRFGEGSPSAILEPTRNEREDTADHAGTASALNRPLEQRGTLQVEERFRFRGTEPLPGARSEDDGDGRAHQPAASEAKTIR